MAAAKKTFKGKIDPAMNFISQESIDRVEGTSGNDQRPAPPDGYKMDPGYVETKSARIQLLIQPTLKGKLKARADQEGISLNELIHRILSNAMRED